MSRKAKIEYSNIIKKKIILLPKNQKKALQTIKSNLEQGLDISSFLSNELYINKFSISDRLKDEFGIYHAHLGQMSKNRKFVTRTDRLLFFFIVEDNITNLRKENRKDDNENINENDTLKDNKDNNKTIVFLDIKKHPIGNEWDDKELIDLKKKILEEQMEYIDALEFATHKHEGQFRKGGDSYITHPMAVAEILREKGFGIEYQVTGLFHDLLEDTNATEDEILMLSNEKVLEAVILLTKKKGYVMEEYISNICHNQIAYNVKLADRLHNIRCAVCCEKEFKIKLINETKTYFYPIMKKSLYEKEITEALERLIYTL